MATNAISSNAVVKTDQNTSPHKPVSQQLPSRIIASIFTFLDVSSALTGKRVCKDFKTGFGFWVKTVQALDLQKTSVLDLARLFGKDAEVFPYVKTLKVSLDFFNFLIRGLTQVDVKTSLEAMIDRIPVKCPNVSDLSIAEDKNKYGQDLVEGLQKTLRRVEITLYKFQNVVPRQLVKYCPPDLTQFKVAGIFGNQDLFTVLNCPKLTVLEAENVTDPALMVIANKHDTKTLALTELSFSWKSSPTPMDVGFDFLKSCEKLKHLSLQFVSAQLHNSVTAKTMIGLVEDLPELETFSLEADAGTFDNAAIGIALAKSRPKLTVRAQYTKA